MLDLALDFLLVRKELARARSYAPWQRARIARLSAAADARTQAARELRTRGLDGVRAALLREALAMRAEAAGVDARVLVRSALDENAWRLAGDALDSRDPLHFELLDDKSLSETIEALEKGERAARKAVEPRTMVALHNVRALRVVTFVAAVIWLAWTAVERYTASPNVAFHKDVTASGYTSRDPSALVDGDTDREHPPVLVQGAGASFTVDLAGVYRIDRVRVYNRRDGFLDAALPLSLDVSEDGSTWSTYDVLHDHFIVWDTRLKNTHARYVRIRAGGTSLGLLEIEVLGRYGK